MAKPLLSRMHLSFEEHVPEVHDIVDGESDNNHSRDALADTKSPPHNVLRPAEDAENDRANRNDSKEADENVARRKEENCKQADSKRGERERG
mgnify:FL=1